MTLHKVGSFKEVIVDTHPEASNLLKQIGLAQADWVAWRRGLSTTAQGEPIENRFVPDTKQITLPKLFIDGCCKGGIGECLEEESNDDLFKYLDDAKVTYVKNSKKFTEGYEDKDFDMARKH